MIKSKHLLFAAYFFFLTFYINAQTLSGVVIDAQTKQPMPYVHIGVIDKNIGVILHDQGKFEIDLSKAVKDDDLIFSMLGYEVVRKKIADIISLNYLEVRLIPKTQELKEVVVRPGRPKPIKLGRYIATHTTIGHSGSEEFGLGGEWGLQIFNKGKKYWIDNVQFHLRFNTVDSILFRIQIYSVKDEMPNASMLTHETFVTSHRNQHWITANLEQENLILNDDVIVTFEVVRIWFSKKTDNELFFTYGKDYDEGKSYSRDSSLDKWKIGQRAPVAMFLTVSEY